MTTTPCFFASFWNASVLGPGMRSASLKYLWSSLWQKYCERKSSCVQMMFAPAFAARSAAASVFLRLADRSAEQEVCSRPSVTADEEERFMASHRLVVEPRWMRAVCSMIWVLPVVADLD